MFSSTVSVGADRRPSPALRRFAWAVLAYFILVILWGAVTRATGAGDGCGNHWPLCNGTVMQHSPSVDTLIEFTHRITSGISVFSVVGLMVWSFRATVRGHLARAMSVAAVAFTMVEAILGALLVKLGLTAQSHSPLRPPYLALHFANTLLLVASLALTAHMLSRQEGYLWRSIRLVSPLRATMGLLAIMAVGVSGSLAALGDTLFPATSLSQALHQDFSVKSGWLLRWRWTHPAIALLACIFVIWMVARAAQRSAKWNNRGLSLVVLALLAAQCALGVLDVVLLAPLWLQVLHLLGADVLWTALVVLTARLTLEPVRQGVGNRE